MKRSIVFFLGILAFAFVIGLMTGASNSPVAGGVIGSLFGVALAVLGLLTNKQVEFKVKLNLIGAGFILLSVGLLVGVFTGITYRTKDHISTNDKKFIWEGTQPPRSTYEAIDWILTNDLLISRGFSRQQVQSIYAIRVMEVVEIDSVAKNSSTPWSSRDRYSLENPFYKMIVGGYNNNLLQSAIATDPRISEMNNKNQPF